MLLVDVALAVAAVGVGLVLARVLPPDAAQRWYPAITVLGPARPDVPGLGLTGPGLTGLGVTSLAVTSLAVASIVLRRVTPWAAVGCCVVGCCAVGIAGPGWSAGAVAGGSAGPMLIQHIGLVVVGYTSASWLGPRAAATAAVTLWVPAVVVVAIHSGTSQGDVATSLRAVFTVLVGAVAFLLGRTVRGRRVSARVLRERTAAAEANQRVLAAHAVTDERRRIARELHDVVAHHISVIGVLSAGARRVLHRDPAAAAEAMATITDTSRTTLREMRRLLDVLRSDCEPDVQLTPEPGLSGIETLIRQVREADLPVSLEVQGTPVPMETGVALTVYRVVQEALTNTMKHAGPATARVRLRFDAEGLSLHVSDTGHGPPSSTGTGVGHGLVGMRERIGLYGGTLRTGAATGGGFAVDATIPRDQLGPDA
jgi:signal transduction histidine kinase